MTIINLRRSRSTFLSSQKLSGAEIASQFRGEAAIWDPAKQALLAMFWIPASVNEYLAGMTVINNILVFEP
jgi:hypothetical protein